MRSLIHRKARVTIAIALLCAPVGCQKDQPVTPEYAEYIRGYMTFDGVPGVSIAVIKCQDVLSVFYDLRNGVSLSTSFEDHFGVSVDTFEDEFYDRMRTYFEQLHALWECD